MCIQASEIYYTVYGWKVKLRYRALCEIRFSLFALWMEVGYTTFFSKLKAVLNF